MITEGRIPMSDTEQASLEELLATLDEPPVGFTRRDPGETGPVLVHLANGDAMEVPSDG